MGLCLEIAVELPQCFPANCLYGGRNSELLRSFRHWSGPAQHRSGLPPIRGLTNHVIAGRRFEETHSPVLLPIARINPDFFFLGQGYPTNHFYISLASRS